MRTFAVHFAMLPELAFRRSGRFALASLEGGKDAPPAPDYAGAAQATAQGNLEAARATAAANRVNQYTPYGNLVYSHTPTTTFDDKAYRTALEKYNSDLVAYNSYQAALQTGISDISGIAVPPTPKPIAPDRNNFMVSNPDEGWAATQTLSPAEQRKLEATNALTQGLLSTANKGLGYADQALNTGGKLDESRLAQPGISGQTVQDAILSRLRPQIDTERQSLATTLANKGLMEGSEAWRNAFRTQDQKENDLYTQAALQGINTGLQSRQQGIQEQYAAQNRPIDIINALRTGNQVNLPQFTNVPQQGQTAGADLLQAAQLRGQYDSGNAAAQNASTGQLAGTALTAAAIYF